MELDNTGLHLSPTEASLFETYANEAKPMALDQNSESCSGNWEGWCHLQASKILCCASSVPSHAGNGALEV